MPASSPKPVSPVDTGLFDLHRQELARELGQAPGELLDELCRHVLGRQASLSLEKVIHGLLDARCSLSALTAALLRSELRHLETLLPTLCRQPATEQMPALKAFLSPYERMRAHWIELVVQYYDNRLETLTRQRDQDRDLLLEERTRTAWLKAGRIRLFNYFHELLVVGVAAVEEVDNRTLTVRMTPKLERVFAAGEGMCMAYTDTPDPNRSMRLEVLRLEDDRLSLGWCGFAEHLQSRRKLMRVQVEGEVAVTLIHRGRSLKARVVDVSETGLGLHMPAPAPELSPAARITIRGTLDVHGHKAALDIPATVCWVNHQPGAVRLGVLLTKHQGRCLSSLQAIMVGYEQTIIQRLRERGTPERLL